MQNPQAASMDSVLLKSDYKGQLITLCIKDDDKTILLIVKTVIVNKEDGNNYAYFFRNYMMRTPAFASTFNTPDMSLFTDAD